MNLMAITIKRSCNGAVEIRKRAKTRGIEHNQQLRDSTKASQIKFSGLSTERTGRIKDQRTTLFTFNLSYLVTLLQRLTIGLLKQQVSTYYNGEEPDPLLHYLMGGNEPQSIKIRGKGKWRISFTVGERTFFLVSIEVSEFYRRRIERERES